jgi:hypothetical protein
MKNKLNLIAISLLSLAFFSGCNDSNSANKAVNNSANNTNTAIATSRANAPIPPAFGPHDDSKVNAANFAKMEKGMKYSDAVKLLGSEGEVIGVNDIPGAKTVMYQWTNKSGAFLKAVFQNEKLIDKVQTGLR